MILAWSMYAVGLALIRPQMAAADYQEAESFLDEALEIFRSQNHTLGIAKCLTSKGELARLQAALERAASAYEQAAALFSQPGNSAGMSANLANLGWVMQRLGDDIRARHLFHESLSLAQRVHDRLMTLDAIAGLAVLAVKVHDLERAVPLFGSIESQRNVYGNALCAADYADYEPFIGVARSQIDPADFDLLWEEGTRLTLEQAVARA